MIKIDFSKIMIKGIEGDDVSVDISKDLGNMMYYESRDIEVADLGYKIYHEKEVDLTEEQAEMVRPFVMEGFKALVKKVLLPILETKKQQG